MFDFRHSSNKPPMEEYRAAQPASGCPIRLPLGLTPLWTQDNPDVIKAYTDILGSLKQAIEGSMMDKFQARDCHSSMTIHILTMNHGNLTRNPKLDGRELKNMPMRDRPVTRMLLHNSAHIICLNEADAFLDPQDEKCKELIRLFILSGYKGIVIKSWSARPIACFVHGNKHARVIHLNEIPKLGNHIRNVQMFLWHRDRLHRCGIRYANLRLPGDDKSSYVQGKPQALCRQETATTNFHPDLWTQQGNCGDSDRPE